MPAEVKRRIDGEGGVKEGEGRGAEFILLKVVFISTYTQWVSS